MPIEEITESILRSILRCFSTFFIEIIFEILIRKTGFLICRVFSKKINPDSSLTAWVGFAFWVLLGFSVFYS